MAITSSVLTVLDASRSASQVLAHSNLPTARGGRHSRNPQAAATWLVKSGPGLQAAWLQRLSL